MSIPFDAMISLREARYDLMMCETTDSDHYKKLLSHAEKRIRHAREMLAKAEAKEVRKSS